MKHQTISFIKSTLRIIGYAWIGQAMHLPSLGWLLAISEIVGIVEEIGHE